MLVHMNTFSSRQQLLSFVAGLARAALVGGAALMLSEHRQRDVPDIQMLILHPLAATWDMATYPLGTPYFTTALGVFAALLLIATLVRAAIWAASDVRLDGSHLHLHSFHDEKIYASGAERGATCIVEQTCACGAEREVVRRRGRLGWHVTAIRSVDPLTVKPAVVSGRAAD